MKLYLSSYRMGNNPEEMLLTSAANQNVAVIQNALDCYTDKARRASSLEREYADLQKIGLKPSVIDLRDYFDNSDGLQSRLDELSYLWVVGGNTFVLRRAFAESGLDNILLGMKNNDNFVYAGYSAGACVMAPSLRGIDLVDDPSVIPEGYRDQTLWEGVGLYPRSIAPHYRSDHPESELIEQAVSYFTDNKMPFLPLKDGDVVTYYT